MSSLPQDEARQDETGRSTAGLFNKAKKIWPWVRHSLPFIFFALVLWLLITQAQGIDWTEVKNVVTGYSWVHILISCCLAMATYGAYASYDLFGRYFVKHGISKARTLLIAFICCAFTLNLGGLVGSIGIRYRMYSQRGVGNGDIARIIGLSLTTNWLGYIFLAGLVFVTGRIEVPFGWWMGDLALQVLGGVFLAVVAGYLALSRFAKTRSWTIRGQKITLPSTKIAFGQLLISSTHWLLMCSIIFSFLYTDVGYFQLLGVLLISSIAGLITHIPGGLGVLETVFITLLGDTVAPSKLIAALIAYRAVFYVLPLCIAGVLYLINEVRGRKTRHQCDAPH